MTKRKRLYLTGVGEVLTESAEKKLEQGNSNREPTCSNGKNEEWYLDMGIPIPKDLEEKLNQQDKVIKLEDDDFEEIYTEIMVYLDEIRLVVTDRGLTTVFLKDDLTITVTETSDEIDSYIDYLEMTKWEHLKVYFRSFIRRVKIKLGIKTINN